MRNNICAVVALLLLQPPATGAQTPPRPVDPSRTVTLTLTEYNRLLDLAARGPQGTSQPPVHAVVGGADLRVRVERDVVRGTFNLQGDVLREGVSLVNLVAGATLTDAAIGGRPLPLVVASGTHAALIPGPGPFTLSLEWGAPLLYQPGRASFVLPVPQAGTARATFDLPGDQAEVRLSAGVVTRRTVAGGRTIVEATLDPGSTTQVSWSMRDSAPIVAAREVRAVADVMTLLTIGDADVRMAALIDVTVLQGELRTVDVRLPEGYELTGTSGSTIESSESRPDGLVLTLTDPAARSHQVLVTLERAHDGASFTIDTGLVTVRDMQRERGEVAVEGGGTMDLKAAERDGMQRIDVRELQRPLQSMSRLPVLAAFRYQRIAAAVPGLALAITRFADAGVLAAVADSARATTLVTSEGRALTEIVLRVQNRAQPFLKVSLPPGGTMVSVDVAGQSAKPVLGADGTRVPLLRPGFRPSGPYDVSFVYLHPGTPFERKGEMRVPLPVMDIPVGIVHWELFVPERYSTRVTGGNALDRVAMPAAVLHGADVQFARAGGVAGGVVRSPARVQEARGGLPGQVVGRVTDASGAVLPGVTIALAVNGRQLTAVTGEDGTYRLSGVPSGTIDASASLEGFSSAAASLNFDQRPQQLDFVLHVGSSAETVVVQSQRSLVDAKLAPPALAAPPPNVVELQRRTAGVLPVRVDVPRAGTSHSFVKPLVVDQEVFVTMSYKQR
jgi:hypothetical protein